jgi:hypothetical protein
VHHPARPIRSADDLSSEERDQVVELELADGSVLDGRMVSSGGPTILFQVANQVIPRRIEIASIRRLTVRQRVRGAIEGGLIGSGIAAVVLAGFGLLGGDRAEPCVFGCTPGSRALIFGALGAVGGAGVGAAIGVTAGARAIHPVDVVGPAEAVGPVEAAEPVDVVGPVEAAEPAGPAGPPAP